MARLFRAGDAYEKTFTVSSSTGAAVNADSLPTGTVYQNGTADATAVTIVAGATGVYKATFTIPGGYAAGDTVELLIAATVGGIATKGIVDAIRLVGFPVTALPNAAAGTAGGLDMGGIISSGTAQAGTTTTITLTAGDAGTVGQYVGMLLYTTGGTGAGQLRTIASYNAGTKVATLAGGRTFSPAPDVTTTYTILRNAHPALNDSLQVVSSSVAGNVTGSVASVTGSVGSVAGNVTGSVGSVTGAVGSVTAAVTTDVSSTVATNLNATVSSRATPAQILATPANLLATDASGNVTVGTLTTAALASIWNVLTSTLTTAGSIGKLLSTFVFTGSNVNAAAQTNADKAGYSLASTGLDAVSTADVTSDADMRSTMPKMIRGLLNRFYDNVTQTATTQIVRNDAGTTISTMAISDDGTTATKSKSS